MPHVHLSNEEVADLRRLLGEITARHRSVEDSAFLQEASVFAHEIPRRLRAALNTFRLTEPTEGHLILSGFPVDDERLGATPAHWKRSGAPSPALEQEVLFVLFSCLLGDCIGWSTQQGGRVVHDVLPVKGLEHEQIGIGSEQTIWWHTEEAFHPLRGDYVGLMCLRNDDKVPTTVASLEKIRLDDDDRQALFEPLYPIRPDHSHLPTGNEVPEGSAGSAEQYRWIEERQLEPEKIAILSGNPRSPYIRIDPYFMLPPEESRARKAFAALREAIDRELREVVLAPGDVCFIDNFKAVHGRRGFRARYDGRDRWLLRINLTRDLRKSSARRLDAMSRIVL